jgi:hypothetical protein
MFTVRQPLISTAGFQRFQLNMAQPLFTLRNNGQEQIA